jgi:ribosomal protein S18 acetylase RimI-like enzyme
MTSGEGLAAGGQFVAPTRLPLVPAHLAVTGVSLRERTGADAEFVRDVYVAYRWPELSVTGWPDAVKLEFLHEQHRMQDAHYGRFYQGAAWGIVEMRGERAGRLYLFRQGTDLRIVDIALLPAFRNLGLGSSLIKAVQSMAAEERLVKVSIQAEGTNRALRLYERLGFRAVETRSVHHRLEWRVPVSEEGDRVPAFTGPAA